MACYFAEGHRACVKNYRMKQGRLYKSRPCCMGFWEKLKRLCWNLYEGWWDYWMVNHSATFSPRISFVVWAYSKVSGEVI
jgi:hypothetical protein